MQTQTFADMLNANIDNLNLSGCIGWKCNTEANNGFPVLQGMGESDVSGDTTPPTISVYQYQNYADGTETIHATVADDSSGIAIQKYAAGTQPASYFATNGTEFNSSTINGLTIGTYTIYAKDNAGNETTKATTYTAISGTGTSSDPYVITTPLQLAVITTGLGKCYKLGNNIDLSSYKDWTPIGNTSKPFTGTFDGDGYTISNLTIGTESSPSALSYLGLFGYTGTATIKNVGLKNASIYSTGDNIGGLVGCCNGNAIITNTYIIGNVSGCSYVGGLIGHVLGSNSVISNSYATAEVSGSSNYVGGLVGAKVGAIINCYCNSVVKGSSYIGGLTGHSNGTITNSYATGIVTGASHIGGLVGMNYDKSKIINSYAAGNVSGNQYVGAFIGSKYGEITDSYWKTNAQIPGCGERRGTFTAIEMLAETMQTQTFADALNANIDNLNLSGCTGWKCNSEANNGFPVLQGIGDGVAISDTTAPTITVDAFQNYTSGVEIIHAAVVDDNSGIAIQKYAVGTQPTSYFATNGTVFNSSIINGLTIGTYTIYAKDNAGNEATKVITYTPNKGSGTSPDPYVITTASELAAISTGLGYSYKLGNDIDLSSYANWMPIGNNSKFFTGSFDGSGHTISNLTIGTESIPSTLPYQGLFGYIGAATIKNVGLKNTSIYSNGDYVGGIAGYCNGNGTITNTYVTGNVLGNSNVGCLIGYVSGSNAVISNSFATAEVSGSRDYVGGLVGQSSGTIMNCYVNSIVRGASSTGGIVGYNKGKITNSYVAGSATGNQTIGCFVGSNSGKVISGYWKTTAQMSGYGYNSGAFTATEMPAATMQTQTFADTLNENISNLGLTFCVGWKYYSGVNSGFPVLQGIGDGDVSSDTEAPTIEAFAFQNYNDGTETIQTIITDDSSGIAIQKYAEGIQPTSYFASSGNIFTSSTVSRLIVGTYTIYAKDNAGNETTKVVTFTPVNGSGISSDPYIITTAAQLVGVSTGLGKYYKLGNNIDLSNYPNWEPIGNNIKPFTGSFDGSGYTISNLTIGTSSEPSNLSYLGLFGSISNASIKDLCLNVSIYSSGFNIGGLVGYYNGSGKITNSCVSGNVSGSSYVGGLIGNVLSSSAIISDSYSTAEVIGSSNFIGSLIGQNGGTVTNSYAKGNVSGNSSVGGMVGQNRGTVTNCYAIGDISGTSNLGGFVGDNGGKVINSYAAGKVFGNSNVGGFAGKNTNTITRGYWNTTENLSGYGLNSGTFAAAGMAPADMQTLAFAYTLSTNIDDLGLSGCVDWKYVNGPPVLQGVGEGIATEDTTPPMINAYAYQNYSTGKEEIYTTIYDDNSGIAIQKFLAGEQTIDTFKTSGIVFTGTTISDLTAGTYTIYAKDNAGNEAIKVVTYSSALGDGTDSNPYIITTAGQLAAIPTGLEKCYKLGNNIDLSSYRNWKAIGTSTNPFTGTFDGNGHTISNLMIGSSPVPSSQPYLGLFGVINKAIVKNITVYTSIYSSGNYIGGLIGKSSNSSIVENAYLFGTVLGNNYVGGIVGYNESSIINSSSSECMVSNSGNNAGGLVGSNVSAGRITNSYSTGNVFGDTIIGGFVGSNTGTVINSYETGNASGNSNIGGFVGTNSGSIINSYEAGGVSGTSNAGGFIGTNGGALTNCYYNATSNSAPGSSDVTGITFSAMKEQSFADTLNSNISSLENSSCMQWNYDSDYNNGLPYLNGVPVYETNFDGTTTTKVTNSDGSMDTKTFDARGNLISNKNSKYGTTTYTYDESGILQTITDPQGTVTFYNSDGTIANETDSNGNSISYTYDSKGNLTSKYDSQFGETTFSYDSNGKIETDPDGTVINYNSNGQTILITYSDGNTSTFKYDDIGNLIYFSNSTYGTMTFAYDSSGNLISVSSPDGTVTTFDPSNKTGKMTYSDGRTIDITYDTLDNISLTKDSVLGISSYIYDEKNRRVSISQPNGQIFNFNTSGNIISIQNQSNSSSIKSLDYSYDEHGNILSVSENGVKKSAYQYDSNNQLIREDNGWLNKTITYTYDVSGNIQTKTDHPYTSGALSESTHIYNYQYNDSDQLINYDGNELTYDGDGNLISYNGSTYSWSGENLNGIANADNQVIYQYNDNGIRTSKAINGKLTAYTLDNKYNVVSQADDTNTLNFIYDMYNCLAEMTFNGTTYTYEKNAQGDIIGLFDSNNNEVVSYTYDSWGNLISIGGTLANTLGEVNPFRYRSYYYDFESNLYYLQSRYYNPEIGRFISKDDSGYHDASDLIDSNLYAYVNNNPIINTDANGHFINTALGTIFGAGYGWLSAKLTGGDPTAGAVSGLCSGFFMGLATDLLVATGGSSALVSAILGSASSTMSQVIYVCMTEKNVDAKYFTQPKVIKELIFTAMLGGIFNVCGYGWTNSFKDPPMQGHILKRLVTLCDIRIQDVRQSIAGNTAINYILGNKQLVINQVYDYLEKDGD
ncbi:GLUG motif-containing protein [Clostridium minihomine]|uniref:GLUG motif-containing protein n=1 Tax=Clostridium minihomine TaxID=2045012 RepID=UPI0013ED659A|nr:GLUG motif-containing protein [Clostridium minihomine]